MPSRTPPTLWKQRSWSPDIIRDEAWERRKKGLTKKRTKSLTDDDIDELKACIELGFGFKSLEIDPKLSTTIPALELYYAVVNKQYGCGGGGGSGSGGGISRTSSMCSSTNSMSVDDESDQLEISSPLSPLIDLCDDPNAVKARLRQWAQVVGCAEREAVSSFPDRVQFEL